MNTNQYIQKTMHEEYYVIICEGKCHKRREKDNKLSEICKHLNICSSHCENTVSLPICHAHGKSSPNNFPTDCMCACAYVCTHVCLYEYVCVQTSEKHCAFTFSCTVIGKFKLAWFISLSNNPVNTEDYLISHHPNTQICNIFSKLNYHYVVWPE